MIKNKSKEEYELPTNLDALNKWTIPRIEPSLIYKLGTFEKIGLKQVIKTTEETVPLNSEGLNIRLLEESDLLLYRNSYKFMHIGLVQIAFKPLTLEGLPESFIAALRDGRNLNYKQSLMGIIQISLAHGPVYFDVYPNMQLSLSDINILDALTLNVKTNGYNYKSGTEVIAICYRIYYKPLFTLNPHCRIMDKQIKETVIIESNFSKSSISTRRKIKWEEIEFPSEWILAEVVQPQPISQNELINLIQSPEGDVTLEFDNLSRPSTSSRPSSRLSKSNSIRNYISPFDFRIEKPVESSRASTSQIREQERIEKLIIDHNNIVSGINTKDPEITESEKDFDF
ncbi:hypothetical protein QQ045_007516 [Rhodiola kirilowii]